MLKFKKADISDVKKLSDAFNPYQGKICDYSAGNVVFWREHYGISYHLDEDCLVLKYENMGKRECYSYPISNKPVAVIRELFELVGDELCLSCLTEENLETVRQKFNVTDVIYSEDFDDYLYLAEDIVTLKGRKYNGQRNHINKFKRLYPDARFEVITQENAHLAKEFCEYYFKNIAKETNVSATESKQLPEMFDNWERYMQYGGMLIVDGRAVGISVGEIVNDTLIIHVEKADTAFEGVYPMLTNCFAREFADTERCRFINREEDCGEAGLRTSKKSYHPIEMIRKYAVVIKKESCS